MNYGLLKMKSILFNSKCGDADSCEQYGGDDSDQQKEQDHFSCIELSDMPDQSDQSQRTELHNDEKAGTAYSTEKFLLEKSRQVGTWPYTNETRISMTPPMAIRNRTAFISA